MAVPARRVNKAKRYQQIARVMVKHGFGWLLAGSALTGLGRRSRERLGLRRVDTVTQAQHLRMALEELGATFIKLGQVLSTRADLLPQEYIDELSKLQDDAPPVPYSAIAPVVAAELGSAPEDVFQELDHCPRAAASLGQVHSARLGDGTRVAVKVQRPGVHELVEEDLEILAGLARVAQNTEHGRRYDIEGWLDEFAFALRNELDYRREGRNADSIRGYFSKDATIHIPRVYWEYTTQRVLTMEAVDGIKISDLAALDAAGINRHDLAERCARIAIVQVLDHGFYHADPHPGNFFVLPDGSIGLLDYGLVGHVDEPLRRALLRLSIAISRKDPDRLIDELLALGAAPGSVDRRGLRRDAARMLQQYSGRGLGDVSASRILLEVTAAARRHSLQLPSDLTLLVKVIVMDEGLGASLDPHFNLMAFAKPYLKRFWRRTHSPRAMSHHLREGAVDLAELSVDLPQRLRRLSGQLDRGDLAVRTRLEVPDETIRVFQRATNRVALSVLAAGLLVGLSVLALVYRPMAGGLWRLVPTVLLGAAIVVAAWLAGALWKSER